MANKTFNKDVETLPIKNYNTDFKNIYNFTGLNTTKNQLTVDQDSFSDCDNVYVDDDNLLSSRPGIRRSVVIPDGYLVKKIYNINIHNLSAYQLLNTSDSKEYLLLIFNLSNGPLPIFVENYDDAIITNFEELIVVFTSERIQGYIIDGENVITKTAAEILYAPATTVVGNNVDIKNEERNILTLAYRILVVTDDLSTLAQNTELLIDGREITISSSQGEITIVWETGQGVAVMFPLYTLSSLTVKFFAFQNLIFAVDNDPDLSIYVSTGGNVFVKMILGDVNGTPIQGTVTIARAVDSLAILSTQLANENTLLIRKIRLSNIFDLSDFQTLPYTDDFVSFDITFSLWGGDGIAGESQLVQFYDLQLLDSSPLIDMVDENNFLILCNVVCKAEVLITGPMDVEANLIAIVFVKDGNEAIVKISSTLQHDPSTIPTPQWLIYGRFSSGYLQLVSLDPIDYCFFCLSFVDLRNNVSYDCHGIIYLTNSPIGLSQSLIPAFDPLSTTRYINISCAGDIRIFESANITTLGPIDVDIENRMLYFNVGFDLINRQYYIIDQLEYNPTSPFKVRIDYFLGNQSSIHINGLNFWRRDNRNFLTNVGYFFNGRLIKFLNVPDVFTIIPVYLKDNMIMIFIPSESLLYRNGKSTIIWEMSALINGAPLPMLFDNAIANDDVIVSKKNILFWSQPIRDNAGNVKIYFPVSNKKLFISNIENMISYQRDKILILTSTQTIVQEKLDLTGAYSFFIHRQFLKLIQSDIILNYLGEKIIFPTQKGLINLNYQQLTENENQVLFSLSDDIVFEYLMFFNGEIKLAKFNYWLFMYRSDLNYLYVYDERYSTWWKWTYFAPITQINNNNNNLNFLINQKLYELDFSLSSDFDETNLPINCMFQTQNLHFDKPNNWKHLRRIDLHVDSDNKQLNYKITVNNNTFISNDAFNDITHLEKVNLIKNTNFKIKIEFVSEFKFKLNYLSLKNRVSDEVR